MADIRKEIKFVADLESLRTTMQEIAPLFKQMEQQLQLNIPIKPSLVDANGRPYTGMPPAAGGGMGQSMADLKQSPAYQLLQMQEALRTRTDKLGVELGGKSPTQIMEERVAAARSGGRMTDITAMEKLAEHSKGLDAKFGELTKTIDELDKRTKTLSEEEFKQALEAKKELSSIQKQRIDLMQQVGTGGGGGIGGYMMEKFAGAGGVIAAVKAIQMGAEIPMQRAAARAATGQVAYQNIAASTDLTNFENIQRINPEMQAIARSSSRFTGTVRGLGEGTVGAGMMGAGVGAGLAGAAALGLAPFTGGASLATLMALGAAGGVGLKGGANWFSGNVEKRQAETFEERMASEIAAKGATGGRINSLFGVSETMFPMQQAFGMGTGATGGMLRQNAGMFQRYGLSMQDFSNMMMGSAGAMGGGINSGVLNTAGRLMRGTGLSAGDIGQGFNAFSTVGGSGPEQARNLEDIMARGVARGYSNAPLARQYLDILSRVAAQAGGGFGMSNAGAVGAMAGTIRETFGGEANVHTATAAMAAQGAMDALGTATGGIGGMANAMAADQAKNDLISQGVAPGKAFAIARMIMTSSQQELTSKENIEKLAGMANIDPGIMRGIVGRASRSKIIGVQNIMAPLAGGSKELGSALAMNLSGAGLSDALGASMVMGKTAEKFLTGEPFEGGTGKEAAMGKGIISGRVDAVSGTVTAMANASSALNAIATAFNQKTMTEFNTMIVSLNTGLSKVNPEAEHLGIYFKAMNEQLERNLRLHGVNPKDLTEHKQFGSKN